MRNPSKNTIKRLKKLYPEEWSKIKGSVILERAKQILCREEFDNWIKNLDSKDERVDLKLLKTQ